MIDWLSDVLRGRPWWMNALMVFCAFMTFVYLPWDLFWKPVADDQEVWFGIMFTGWAAKTAALPHWFVYGAGLYGFRRMRPWMCTWGAVYVAQIAFGMYVWTVLTYGGLLGLLLGLFPAAPFALLALAFWNAEQHFCAARPNARERYGEWAIVTGASSGLGMEFARALARDGVSCVLVARREDRLRELAAELEKSCSVQTRVVAVDLAQPDAGQRVAGAVDGLEISILVNNAGVGAAGRFDLQDGDRLAGLVDLNCRAPTQLTAAFLPSMRARRRGAVIFTGSVAGAQPLPLHATYSATKAFNNFLAEALYVECRESGVDVLSVQPGPLESEFTEVAGELPRAGQAPAAVVAAALEALGRQPALVTGWLNWLRALFAQRVGSRLLVSYIGRDVMAGQTPGDMR